MSYELKAYALEKLREYIVYGNIEIKDKNDIKSAYSKMVESNYFDKEKLEHVSLISSIIEEFAEYYDKDPNILDEHLIGYGPTRVLDALQTDN